MRQQLLAMVPKDECGNGRRRGLCKFHYSGVSYFDSPFHLHLAQSWQKSVAEEALVKYFDIGLL